MRKKQINLLFFVPQNAPKPLAQRIILGQKIMSSEKICNILLLAQRGRSFSLLAQDAPFR
jgi:hypothetical protein